MVVKDKSDEKTDYDKDDRSPNINLETFEDSLNSIDMKNLKNNKQRDQQSKVEQKIPSLYDTNSFGESLNSLQSNNSTQFQSTADSEQWITPGQKKKEIRKIVNMEEESVDADSEESNEKNYEKHQKTHRKDRLIESVTQRTINITDKTVQLDQAGVSALYNGKYLCTVIPYNNITT